MNRRSTLVVTLALGLLLAPLAAAAQVGKEARIGFLWVNRPEDQQYLRDAFRQGLHEHGWVEGKNITIEYRWAEGRVERLADLASELVRLKVDVIVAATASAIQAAKTTTKTIPIVMAVSGDPVGEGFVASLARPGGNITGLALFPGPEIVGKLLQLLKEVVPAASRVGVLANPANTVHAILVREVKGAADSLGVQLQVLEARGPNDLDGAFAAMTREGASALLVLGDARFLALRGRIADLAAKNRLPTMYGVREHVEAGGLMAYGASLPETVRRAATFVDKILKGAKPADLPVEQPTKFELVINLKTAKALGLTIPQSVLMRADEVIR